MLRIRNGRVINPADGFDQVTDIWIRDGRILGYGKNYTDERADETINASGCIVAPGLVDVHVHVRDPGQT